MELPALLCSDLHLTSAPKDAYRLGLFPWLVTECASRGVKTLGILGDITDAKEGHSAELVTQISDGVASVSEVVAEVDILLGNHDYQRRGFPFFRFLARFPRVNFVCDRPTVIDGGRTNSLWLPHTKSPVDDWDDFDMSHFNFVFMHQTVTGSVASNGMRMDGEPLPDLSQAGKVYSGDIHVPQVIGAVEYVGSPYHVHFGDRFTPRCVLLRGNGHPPEDLHFPCISRYVITAESVADLKSQLRRVRPGDQIRVRMKLSPEAAVRWESIRAEVVAIVLERGAQSEGVELRQVRPASHDSVPAEKHISTEGRILGYVSREGLGPDAFEVGMEVVE